MPLFICDDVSTGSVVYADTQRNESAATWPDVQEVTIWSNN